MRLYLSPDTHLEYPYEKGSPQFMGEAVFDPTSVAPYIIWTKPQGLLPASLRSHISKVTMHEITPFRNDRIQGEYALGGAEGIVKRRVNDHGTTTGFEINIEAPSLEEAQILCSAIQSGELAPHRSYDKEQVPMPIVNFRQLWHEFVAIVSHDFKAWWQEQFRRTKKGI